MATIGGINVGGSGNLPLIGGDAGFNVLRLPEVTPSNQLQPFPISTNRNLDDSLAWRGGISNEGLDVEGDLGPLDIDLHIPFGQRGDNNQGTTFSAQTAQSNQGSTENAQNITDTLKGFFSGDMSGLLVVGIVIVFFFTLGKGS